MTLEEARADIDAVDTQMKPLFLKRMECAKKVAEVKAQTGGDVFVLERELSIIEKRAGDVDKEVYDEYVTFLRHLMSVSRRYQYGKLTASAKILLCTNQPQIILQKYFFNVNLCDAAVLWTKFRHCLLYFFRNSVTLQHFLFISRSIQIGHANLKLLFP